MKANELPDNAVEHWRLLYEESLADKQSVAYFEGLDANRLFDRQEMVALLNDYLESRISTEEFRATFDRKTRGEWDTFGLKGMSGGMFLNVLVKYITDEQMLAKQLRQVLLVPENTNDGRDRMRNFMKFLEGLIVTHQTTKRQIQPARAPFFVSAWWHLQATEQWPIFYPLTRQKFELDGLYTSTQNPVEDYFTYRDSFLSLMTTLGLTVWQLEHLSAWYGDEKRHALSIEASKGAEKTVTIEPEIVERPKPVTLLNEATSIVSEDKESAKQEQEDEQVVSEHVHIQLVLAKIGRKLGCRVWVAANDQNRMWNGERLGDLSLKNLPDLWMDSEFQRTISLIDVLWIKGTNQIAAAFEVEHTTSIYSGLLRMSDLVALAPNSNFPLYIVTPAGRLDKVRRELSRPTFQTLELHRRCGFFSEDLLLQEADNIMRWASHPSIIDNLASKVGDVDG